MGFGNVRSGQDTYGTVLVDHRVMLAIAGKLEKGFGRRKQEPAFLARRGEGVVDSSVSKNNVE